MRKIKIKVGLFILAFSCLYIVPSCMVVKEYQKMYVNDKDMELNTKDVEQFEGNMELFREGAGGANGGKSGGGCACN